MQKTMSISLNIFSNKICDGTFTDMENVLSNLQPRG